MHTAHSSKNSHPEAKILSKSMAVLSSILQSIFICVQLKNETQTGLEQEADEEMVTVHFWVKCPFKKAGLWVSDWSTSCGVIRKEFLDFLCGRTAAHRSLIQQENKKASASTPLTENSTITLCIWTQSGLHEHRHKHTQTHVFLVQKVIEQERF